MFLVASGFLRTRVESAARMGGSIGAAVVKPVARPLGGAALATLDAVLQSRLAGDVIERVAASPLGERAISGALEGPLVEAVARDLVRYRVADRLLSEELVEATTTRVLDGTELEQVVEAALDSPTVERLDREGDRQPARRWGCRGRPRPPVRLRGDTRSRGLHQLLRKQPVRDAVSHQVACPAPRARH